MAIAKNKAPITRDRCIVFHPGFAFARTPATAAPRHAEAIYASYNSAAEAGNSVG